MVTESCHDGTWEMGYSVWGHAPCMQITHR